MALETGTHIDDLVPSNPASTDGLAQADDHIRLLKATIKTTFPSVTGAITATHTELNVLDGLTATTAELNVLDGLTATTADLNYAKDLRDTNVTATEYNRLDGVTSGIQLQLNSKAPLASPDFTGTVGIGADWTVTQSGSNLKFAYNGTNRMKLDSSGNLTVEGNVTAYGSA